jgi:hypothetical protein
MTLHLKMMKDFDDYRLRASFAAPDHIGVPVETEEPIRGCRETLGRRSCRADGMVTRCVVDACGGAIDDDFKESTKHVHTDDPLTWSHNKGRQARTMSLHIPNTHRST